jgi:hypothetical protein
MQIKGSTYAIFCTHHRGCLRFFFYVFVVIFSFPSVKKFGIFYDILDYITLFTLVLQRSLGGVIFVVDDFFLLCLPFVPL